MARNEAAALREGPRSFAVLMREIGQGALDRKASEVYQKLLLAIEQEAMSRGKAKGTITIKVMTEIDNKGNGNVTFAVDKKEPTKVESGGPIWLSKGSNYLLEPPGRDKRIREVTRAEPDDEPEVDDEEDDNDDEGSKPVRATKQRPNRQVRTV